MGQMARMARAERFIAEFRDDLLKQIHIEIAPGDKLTVRNVVLGHDSNVDECVYAYVILVDEHAKEHELQLGTLWFDPGESLAEDSAWCGSTRDRLLECGLTEGAITERLRKADLID